MTKITGLVRVRRRRAFVVVVGGALPGLCGALLGTRTGSQEVGKPPANAERTVDAASKMSFIPPAGWRRSKQIPPPTILYVAPGRQDQAVNIGVISAPVGDITLDRFVKANRDFAGHTRGLTLYAVAPATLDGEKALAWRMHVSPPKGVPHEIRQVLCVHNRRSYVLTLAALPSNMKKYDPVFDKVVASFKWEN